MLSSKNILSILVIAMSFGQAYAQDQKDDLSAEMQKAEAQLVQQEKERETAMRQAEAQRLEQEKQYAAASRQAEEQRRSAEIQMEQAAVQMERAAQQHREAMSARARSDRSVQVEVRMKEAEHALAEAAQQMGQLSMRQLPRARIVERIVRGNRGPVLGVSISGELDGNPVEGVNIIGVSPGGAADEAGLRAGDVITSINDESLTAASSDLANDKLLDFMSGVEEGDVLSVDYLRDGDLKTAELKPKLMNLQSFAFSFDSDDFTVPNIHVAPNLGGVNRFVWVTGRAGFGDMELVKLTEELGNYFGTSEGLLVVRAPENEELKLKDGDVIQSIDGRQPTSASHAMRILGSYESGETLKIEIMRDKRKQSVSIEVPENTQSWNTQSTPVAPAVQVRPRGTVVVPPKDSN